MPLAPDYEPEFDSLRDLLLEIAPERSVEHLLRKVVQRLAERPHAVLARLWLLDKGDLCASCPMRPRCPDQTRCLHLVASAGNPECRMQNWRVFAGEERRRRNGRSRRYIGAWNCGGFRSASGRLAALPPRASRSSATTPAEEVDGFGERGWAARQGIRGLGGQPIIFQNESLGVIAQFNRIPTPDHIARPGCAFSRTISPPPSSMRAPFEEIEQLKAHLELENTFLQEEVQEAKGPGRNDRPERRLEEAPAPGGNGGANRRHGADSGRIRHGQGIGRPRNPQEQPAQRAAA
jgi:hypothetical protein